MFVSCGAVFTMSSNYQARLNALPLSSSTLLVRVGALLLLAYPRDQCLGLYSTFFSLLILVLYLHPALWRVIPTPITSKPTSTAWQHKLILQFVPFRMPRTPLMRACRLIACFRILRNPNTSGLVLVNNWISWSLRPCFWSFLLLSSLPLSGTWGSSLTRSYPLLSISPRYSLLLLPLTPVAGGLPLSF